MWVIICVYQSHILSVLSLIFQKFWKHFNPFFLPLLYFVTGFSCLRSASVGTRCPPDILCPYFCPYQAFFYSNFLLGFILKTTKMKLPLHEFLFVKATAPSYSVNLIILGLGIDCHNLWTSHPYILHLTYQNCLHLNLLGYCIH